MAEKPNVLFITVDDLRPELNCYGKSHIQSPNIDKLAQGGILFSRAYCNVPVCGASRASFLTGTRPTRNRFLTYDTWAEKDNPEAIPLPQHFRNNGYFTVSNGKVFHNPTDSEDSWDEIWQPEDVHFRTYLTAENLALAASIKKGYPYERAAVSDSIYYDGKVATKAIVDLQKLKGGDKPFFLAVGFFRPHLPFNAPEKYWNLYERRNISLPVTYKDSANAPAVAFLHNFAEMKQYYGYPPKGPVSDSIAISLIHGYYASVSYVDAQVGRVLDALEELGLKENTIVVLLGDHGFNLGEHGTWCKHSNFNTSLQAPLLFSGPGVPENKKSNQLVEFVDIFPTLIDLANLPTLPNQLEGASMLPIMQQEDAPWDGRIVSKYVDGLTIKTGHYMYTEWSKSDSNVYARMLFDHARDPDERMNIAELPESQELIRRLQQELYENRGKDFNEEVKRVE
ncbi:Iduronate-2-sulfatase [Flammeovirgaceae bacterium 311]|nr:Iduronate-2-sulfatase [Flammeovirgaceae bacterium 311]